MMKKTATSNLKKKLESFVSKANLHFQPLPSAASVNFYHKHGFYLYYKTEIVAKPE